MGATGRAAGQVPEHPGVDGADGQIGGGLHPARAEQPLQLGGGEVGIEHQAGGPPDEVQVPVGLQLSAAVGGAAVLPDDRPVQGLAGAPVPDDGRLALVGDADRGDRRLPEAVEQVGERGGDRFPDVDGVVLHPPRPGEVLGELPVGEPGRPAVLVQGEAADAGRPGVDRDDHGHGPRTLVGCLATQRR
jgi:hypothetical protein